MTLPEPATSWRDPLADMAGVSNPLYAPLIARVDAMIDGRTLALQDEIGNLRQLIKDLEQEIIRRDAELADWRHGRRTACPM